MFGEARVFGSNAVRVLMMPDYRSENPYQRLLAEAIEAHGATVLFARGYRRGLPLWRAWREAKGVEVLHLHWLTPYLRGRCAAAQLAYCLRFLIDVALLRLCRVAVVWTVHNRVSHESRWPGLEKWVQRRLASMANEIILHARANVEDLSGDLPLPREKVRIIPHGHYRSVYGPAVESCIARSRLGLPDTGRVYLFFGMLRPYKGVERLIAEWLAAPLPAEDVLVIAGKPLNNDFLRSLTQLAHGSPRIKVLDGFVTDERVSLFFSAANVVVLPFHDVLTSGSLLLAMSYGKAVIAPRFGAIAEMLGSAGDLLYDPSDSRGLRNAIEQAARVSLGPLQAGAQRICDSLDWGPLGSMTVAAYRHAIGWVG